MGISCKASQVITKLNQQRWFHKTAVADSKWLVRDSNTLDAIQPSPQSRGMSIGTHNCTRLAKRLFLWIATFVLSLSWVSTLNAGEIPQLSEMRLYTGSFAPRGYMRCDGRELSIAEYTSLYALVGTRFGGDGRRTFKLPDMRKEEARIHKAMGLAENKKNFIIYIIAVTGTFPSRS